MHKEKFTLNVADLNHEIILESQFFNPGLPGTHHGSINTPPVYKQPTSYEIIYY
jgi:hypothetical protein